MPAYLIGDRSLMPPKIKITIRVLSRGVIPYVSPLNLRCSENIIVHNLRAVGDPRDPSPTTQPTARGALARGREFLYRTDIQANVEDPTGSLNKNVDGAMSPEASKDEVGARSSARMTIVLCSETRNTYQ